jgi:hypothetical protein
VVPLPGRLLHKLCRGILRYLACAKSWMRNSWTALCRYRSPGVRARARTSSLVDGLLERLFGFLIAATPCGAGGESGGSTGWVMGLLGGEATLISGGPASIRRILSFIRRIRCTQCRRFVTPSRAAAIRGFAGKPRALRRPLTVVVARPQMAQSGVCRV